MRKDDIEWGIYDRVNDLPRDDVHRWVEICGTTYHVNENTACLTHAMLLLVDAINDKKFNS